MNKILITFLIASFVLPLTLRAHQPRLVDDSSSETVQIKNPEVSQAFYATLAGKEDTYTLSSDTDFLLLVELITPVIEGKEPGVFTVEVVDRDTGNVYLTGTTSPEGSIFYEPFAGDEYIEGPKVEQQAPAGTYDIRVEGDEEKKYVLVVGKRECFPFDEIINTYKSLPSLKMDYFEKPFYTIFTNPTGGGLLVVMIIAGLLVFAIFKFVKRRKNNS